jgi:hypothetical protein
VFFDGSAEDSGRLLALPADTGATFPISIDSAWRASDFSYIGRQAMPPYSKKMFVAWVNELPAERHCGPQAASARIIFELGNMLGY